MTHYVRFSYAHQVFITEHGHLLKVSHVGWEPITFSEKEEHGIIFTHNDLLIIIANISNFDDERVLIDTGSSINVMFTEVFNVL